MPVSKKRKNKKGNGEAKNRRAINKTLVDRESRGNLLRMTNMLEYIEKAEQGYLEEKADVRQT